MTNTTPRALSGRCANGAEGGSGRHWHAVAEDQGRYGRALCGATPGRLSAGWGDTPGAVVSCPRCRRRLDRRKPTFPLGVSPRPRRPVRTQAQIDASRAREVEAATPARAQPSPYGRKKATPAEQAIERARRYQAEPARTDHPSGIRGDFFEGPLTMPQPNPTPEERAAAYEAAQAARPAARRGGILMFSDGVVFDTSGPLRAEERADGWYAVGDGHLCPCADRAEAEHLITDLVQARERRAR